jgi:multidrug resistance efflux pump
LFRAGLLARKDFEESQAYLADRENELEEAKRKLNLLQAGSRPEEIEATRAELDRLEAERHHLEEEVRLARVLSPTSGVVATPSRQLRELVHQWVKKGDLIAKVYDLKTLEAETPILEKEIADVAVGQPVALKVRAYPGRTFCGRVASIGTGAQTATDARDISATRTVLVTARIDNSSLLLKPEMTGNAKVMCGSRRILDLIRRRLARTFEVEFWSWW